MPELTNTSIIESAFGSSQSIKPEYSKWIKNSQYNTQETAYGKCKQACTDMDKEFPFELEMVRGHYMCPLWGERAHWWLKDEAGNIIDPTAIQFPSKGIGEYIEWDESQPEPTGKCPNCGDYCYEGNYCCSDNCFESYRASVMRGSAY